MLYVNFDLAHPDIEQVADAVGFAEGDFGVREDLKSAAVRHLKFGVPVGTGFDGLLLIDHTAGFNGGAVSCPVSQLRNVARLNQYHGFGGLRGANALST